ncbi:MAG TPA: hypothetical protein VGM05_32790 [Planctomycetaceae bacterium]|jgi:hypothetical protein
MSFWFASLAGRRQSRPSFGAVAFLAAAILSCVLMTGTAQGQFAQVTDDQIQGAIKRSVAKLKSRQGSLSGGESAVVAMALLKSGQPPEAPEIKAAIDKIVERTRDNVFRPVNHHVYEAGVSIMALANADPVRYKPQIETIVKFLISVQQPNGGWFYANPGNPTDGDTSITQYAVLGLWEATRAGVGVPKKVWDKAAGWHVTFQNKDGSFSYHPVQGAFGYGQGGSHTMTVAGTASLYVARLHLYPDAKDIEEVKARPKRRGKKYGLLEPAVPRPEDGVKDTAALDASYKITTRLAAIDKAIAGGKAWLTEKFTIEPKAGHDLYYLYGLERLMALANLKDIDGHDWYAEGAAQLCRTQDAAGGWNDGCGPDPATALGLLFLGKATAKMMKRPERRGPERRYGGGLLVGGRGLPDNLESLESDQQGVHVRKLKGPVDELLAQLEKADGNLVESAQTALVETIATENPEALIGQTDRLLKLVGDKRVEVRRTVFWALGRTNDLRVVPKLIAGLSDPDPSCVVEARNALRFISKKVDSLEPPDEPTDAQRAAAIAFWKKWYLGVRAYDERDDVGEFPAK